MSTIHTSLTSLAEKADAATPGPWQSDDGTVFVSDEAYVEVADCGGGEQNEDDAAFIAAASPSVVKALVDVAQLAATLRAYVPPGVRDGEDFDAALARLEEALRP
jgi:hypothetical protein